MATTWMTFIKERLDIVAAGCIILVVVFGSLATLTTKPQLWTDEAVSIHIARGFMNHGVLSIETAPNSLFESAYLIQATGATVIPSRIALIADRASPSLKRFRTIARTQA